MTFVFQDCNGSFPVAISIHSMHILYIENDCHTLLKSWVEIYIR